MQALRPWTHSFFGLCKTQTPTFVTLRLHSKVYQHKLSCLWLQDHPWRFRSSAPLMTREGSNFFNTRSWDCSGNNISRRYERAFWVQNSWYKRGTLFSLWKVLLKMCLGFPLYTRRSRSETLILFGLELLLGLIKILQTRSLIGRAYSSIDQTRQILNSLFAACLFFNLDLNHLEHCLIISINSKIYI